MLRLVFRILALPNWNCYQLAISRRIFGSGIAGCLLWPAFNCTHRLQLSGNSLGAPVSLFRPLFRSTFHQARLSHLMNSPHPYRFDPTLIAKINEKNEPLTHFSREPNALIYSAHVRATQSTPLTNQPTAHHPLLPTDGITKLYLVNYCAKTTTKRSEGIESRLRCGRLLKFYVSNRKEDQLPGVTFWQGNRKLTIRGGSQALCVSVTRYAYLSLYLRLN